MGLINLKKVDKNQNNNPSQMDYSNQQGYPMNPGYPDNNYAGGGQGYPMEYQDNNYSNYQDNQYNDPNYQQNYQEYPTYNQNMQQNYQDYQNYDQNMQQYPTNNVDPEPVNNQPTNVEGGYYEVAPEQQDAINYEAINNLRNISMESTAPAEPEEPAAPEVEKLEEPKEEEKPKLDPLNNANNPIPVNPVAVDVVVDDSGDENVKTGLFVNIGICVGLAFKPATTIVNNTKKFRNTQKAFQVFLWMFVLSLVLCIASRVVLGSFARTYSNLTGRYQLSFDLGRVFVLNNYIGWLIATVAISGIFVLLVALVYYASSFMNSKGISFGTYLMLACLGNVPVTVGLLVLFPLGGLFSSYLAVILFFISFLYGFFLFIIGAINVLKFNTVDSLVIYNLINMAIIGVVLSIILVFVVRYTSYDLSYLLSIAGLG